MSARHVYRSGPLLSEHGYLTPDGTYSPWLRDAKKFPSELAARTAMVERGLIDSATPGPRSAYVCEAEDDEETVSP